MSPQRSQQSRSPQPRSQQRKHPRGRGLVQQLVLIVFLVLLWVMLWETVTVVSILSGIALAVLVTRVFYLPPVVLSGRFNLWHSAVFAVWFLWSVAQASVHVAWLAMRRRSTGAGSVIACDLITSSDLLLTLVADTASLIPGSIILEADRAQGILYLHILDCDSPEDIRVAKAQVDEIERLLIRAVGSSRDLAALRLQERERADRADAAGNGVRGTGILGNGGAR